MKSVRLGFCFLVLLGSPTEALEVLTQPGTQPGTVTLVGPQTADILVDANDAAVVNEAALLFSQDVQRVTGKLPAIRTDAAKSPQVIIAGTLDHSRWITKLIAAGKLPEAESIRGKWEATLTQVVEQPLPGIDRALVIVGSDRRGTAYGLMNLSAKIGVSPWTWWADVPAAHHDTLALQGASAERMSTAVKYRGIFINDEDWGLNPWAKTTFDPAFGNIGPKTYEKVYELMLRLKLNYLWPAMHPCTTEFASTPENYILANKYAIVMGSSHCEPMLQNNVHWPKENGPWRYDTNRDKVFNYWSDSVKARGQYEAVWTLGIRGIHDAPMQGPPGLAERIALVSQVITDQRQLLAQLTAPAQCFVPYKEVLPIYNAGLKVPDDVTLVWVDDNYGYIRRLASPAELQRPGGSGIYFHSSYFGGPRSYTWINTTPPALLWEELRKAWDNGTRTIWMLNVGDIKPMESAIDFYAQFACDVDSFGPDAQPVFLKDFAARNFGKANAQPIADFLAEYYRLGQIRKPECMDKEWTAALTPDQARKLQADYQALLDREKVLKARISPEQADAWFELAGYPADVLAGTGLVFMADRLAQESAAPATDAGSVDTWKSFLQAETQHYNNDLAGGKWRNIMPDGNINATAYKNGWREIHWPWMKAPKLDPAAPTTPDAAIGLKARGAGDFNRKTDSAQQQWKVLAGLGHSGKAISLLPATEQKTSGTAPQVEYDFTMANKAPVLLLDFLPTYRLYPGMKLRVSVAVDDAAFTEMEVPGSSGVEDEKGPVRRNGVLNNRVTLQVPLSSLTPGPHVLKVRALDPGVVLDEVELP